MLYKTDNGFAHRWKRCWMLLKISTLKLLLLNNWTKQIGLKANKRNTCSAKQWMKVCYFVNKQMKKHQMRMKQQQMIDQCAPDQCAQEVGWNGGLKDFETWKRKFWYYLGFNWNQSSLKTYPLWIFVSRYVQEVTNFFS